MQHVPLEVRFYAGQVIQFPVCSAAEYKIPFAVFRNRYKSKGSEGVAQLNQLGTHPVPGQYVQQKITKRVLTNTSDKGTFPTQPGNGARYICRGPTGLFGKYSCLAEVIPLVFRNEID